MPIIRAARQQPADVRAECHAATPVVRKTSPYNQYQSRSFKQTKMRMAIHAGN